MTQAAEDQQQAGYCPASMFDRIFSPEDASVVLFSDDGGTGKTFGAVSLMEYLVNVLDRHFVTNIPFKMKSGEGIGDWTEVEPHPNVHVVRDMVELWQTIGEIKRNDPFAIIVCVLDEWDKWCDKILWWEDLPLAFKQWWGENRKYKTVPLVIGQQMTNNPTRPLRYVRWYFSKSRAITKEYNDAYGTSYSCKQLLFIIPVRPEDELEKLKGINFSLNDVVEVLHLERTAWTTDPNTAKVGDICYWSEGSASFDMGKVGDNGRWFPEFLRFISGYTSMELPDKIDDFFLRGAKKPLSPKARLEAALHIYAQHLADDDLSDKGWPMMSVAVPGKRNLQEIELSPANLSRIFKVPERTLRDNVRRWDTADQASTS